MPLPKKYFLKNLILYKPANLWNCLYNGTRVKDTLLSFTCAFKRLK